MNRTERDNLRSARPTRASGGVRAFTLIELILVLTILTIVVAVVMPNFRGFSVGRQSKYAATQFMALTRYARTQSVAEGRVYRMTFEDSSFQLMADTGSGTFEELKSDFGRKYQVPDSVKLELDISSRDDGRYLEFRPSGMADGGRVTFISADGAATDVVANSETDLFHVADGGGR